MVEKGDKQLNSDLYPSKKYYSSQLYLHKNAGLQSDEMSLKFSSVYANKADFIDELFLFHPNSVSELQ